MAGSYGIGTAGDDWDALVAGGDSHGLSAAGVSGWDLSFDFDFDYVASVTSFDAATPAEMDLRPLLAFAAGAGRFLGRAGDNAATGPIGDSETGVTETVAPDFVDVGPFPDLPGGPGDHPGTGNFHVLSFDGYGAADLLIPSGDSFWPS